MISFKFTLLLVEIQMYLRYLETDALNVCVFLFKENTIQKI